MVKKYIIMCGGEYNSFETPRQLSVIRGEELVARTIRLLRENGVTDIAISSNNPIFEKFGIPVLKHENNYVIDENNKVVSGQWFEAFYPTEEPACYVFGDVYFSPEAIKIIVETETDDIELFGSKKPFTYNYIKTHEEPFALKVVNQKHLREAIEKSKELDAEGKFWRKPLVWELFTVIKNAPLQTKRNNYTTDYVGISDYSCDIDRKDDIMKLETILGGNMVKLETTYEFTLGRFDELKNIVRKDINKNEKGRLYIGDIFECLPDLAEYLTGNNDKKVIVAKVIEVKQEPEWKKDGVKLSEEESKELDKQVEEIKKIVKKSIKKSKK